MAAELLVTPSRATDGNNDLYAGAQWHFYASGGVTPQNVYSNASLSTSLGATVTADSAGKFVPIYLNPSLTYRGVLKDSTGATTIYDIDPINSGILSALAASSGSSLVGFLQSGTGAVARTIQDKLREDMAVSVLDFGADRNAVSDSTAAFNNALATGKPVYVPKGTYKVSSLTALDRDSVVIFGDGPDTSIIQQTSTTADLITIGTASPARFSPHIYNLGFSVAATKTEGYVLKATNTFNLRMENVKAVGYFGVVDLVGTHQTRLRDIYCANMVATNGKAISARGGGSNLTIVDLEVDGGGGTQCLAGLYIEQWDGIWLNSGTQFNRCGYAVIFAPPSATFCEHMFFDHGSFDTCATGGILFRGTGYGTTRKVFFNGGSIATNANNGVLFEAGNACNTIQFNDVQIVANASYGIYSQGAVGNLQISGCLIAGNSSGASGTYSGIGFLNGGTYDALRIVNNRIGPSIYPNDQKYAIVDDPATGAVFTNSVIADNDLAGNVTGAINWNLANPRPIFLRNNAGYVTEAQGSVTQTAASATATVTHGLALTPVAGEIAITPHSNINTAVRFWVSGITSTQFTINTDVGPAGDVTWGWQAQIA